MTENNNRSVAKKELTIAILNWNGAILLNKYLPSVIRNTPPEKAEIVVIDNGSTDNSIELLENKFPEVKIIRYTDNAGYALGYNKALEVIDSSYVCLLNSDVEVTKGWIESPLQLLHNSHIAAVQPTIKSIKERSKFEYAGAAGGFLDKYGYPFCRGRIFSTIEEDNGQYSWGVCPIGWASGAALFVNKEYFKMVGGFDPLFFAHMEEIDLAWRFNKYGYLVYYTPYSTVFHLGGASLNNESPKKCYLNFRNNLLMLYKNMPRHKVIPLLIVRMGLDTIAAFKYILQGKSAHAKSIFVAWRDFRKMKKIYNGGLRRDTSALYSTKYSPLAPYSIVWQYYIKKKKTFNELPFYLLDV